MARSFAIANRATTVIRPVKTPLIPYTRAELARLRENPNLLEEIKIERKMQEIERVNSLHFNMYGNDKNPENHIKLEIVKPVSAVQDEVLSKKKDSPFIIIHKKPEENPYVEGTYGSIDGSLKKLMPLANLLQKKYILDAIEDMEKSRKKASEKFINALRMVRDHAKTRGLNPDHLWIKFAILEKQDRSRGIYYHARGRHGKMTMDNCRIKIRLEQKPPEQMFRLYIEGKIPAGLAQVWRDQLKESNSDLETIRRFQFILTAKGRQQRREMIKRRVDKMMLEFVVFTM